MKIKTLIFLLSLVGISNGKCLASKAVPNDKGKPMNKILAIYDSKYMKYPYALPDLPYAYDALEPDIDKKTMELHHDKHHQSYVDKANEAIKSALEKHPALKDKSLVDLLANLDKIPAEIRTKIEDQGGGHLNHSLFWLWMAPKAGGEPKGTIAAAITKTFGSFDKFKEQFNAAAKERFGSGWAWLSVTPAGTLEISSTSNQDTPISQGNLPILGLDVWEHAYYLKYQNKRADYLAAIWNVANWAKVAERFSAAS